MGGRDCASDFRGVSMVTTPAAALAFSMVLLDHPLPAGGSAFFLFFSFVIDIPRPFDREIKTLSERSSATFAIFWFQGMPSKRSGGRLVPPLLAQIYLGSATVPPAALRTRCWRWSCDPGRSKSPQSVVQLKYYSRP